MAEVAQALPLGNGRHVLQVVLKDLVVVANPLHYCIVLEVSA